MRDKKYDEYIGYWQCGVGSNIILHRKVCPDRCDTSDTCKLVSGNRQCESLHEQIRSPAEEFKAKMGKQMRDDFPDLFSDTESQTV